MTECLTWLAKPDSEKKEFCYIHGTTSNVGSIIKKRGLPVDLEEECKMIYADSVIQKFRYCKSGSFKTVYIGINEKEVEVVVTDQLLSDKYKSFQSEFLKDKKLYQDHIYKEFPPEFLNDKKLYQDHIYTNLKHLCKEININNELNKKLPDIVPRFRRANVYVKDMFINPYNCEIYFLYNLQTVVDKADVDDFFFLFEPELEKEIFEHEMFKVVKVDRCTFTIIEFDCNPIDKDLLENLKLYHIAIMGWFPESLERISNILRLGKSKYVTEFFEENKFIIKHLFKAMHEIHECGYIHRDIKDDNFAINITGGIKIIDFGFAKLIKDFPTDMENVRKANASGPFKTDFRILFDLINNMSTVLPPGYEKHPMMMEMYAVHTDNKVSCLLLINSLFKFVNHTIFCRLNDLIFRYNNSNVDSWERKTIRPNNDGITKAVEFIAKTRTMVSIQICEEYNRINELSEGHYK
jgi:serine/threonine protein kinase